MYGEQEWWSVEDLLLDETRGREQDKVFSALLRQRMAAKRKRDDSRDNEKLKRNKRRVK